VTGVGYNGCMVFRALAVGAAAAALLMPGSARADLRAVADGDAPVLAGDSVLWASGGRLLGATLAGAAVPPVGLPVGADDVQLAAGSGLVAALVGSRVYSLAGAAFVPVAGGVRGGAELFATAFGPLVVGDDGRARLRGAEVAVPPGALALAAAGEYGVAATGDGALVVFDLRTGTELWTVSLGRFDAATLSGLAVGADGSVAAAVPVGDGSDVLLWAPPSAADVRVLARGQGFGTVVVDGARVAYVAGTRLGERVRVVDARSGAIVFRGPAVASVSALAFSGDAIAFSTPGCTVAGGASGSFRSLPAGVCVRSSVTVTALAGRGVRVQVACVSAVGAACRVRARVRGRVIGARSASVRVGRTRTLVVPVRRARGSGVRVTVRVLDPDGRSRVAFPG